MRVTFVLPPVDFSGGCRVVAIYADRLQRRGHLVNIVSVPQRRRPLGKLKSLLNGGLWSGSADLEPSHFDSVTVPHRVLDRVRPVLDKDVPDSDVVVATWWETAEWVAKLSPQKGAKAYFIQHHEVFDYLPIERVKATWKLPLHKITISKWLVELAAREYGEGKVWLVPNSVDTEQFSAPPRGRQAQPTIGLLYSTARWKGINVSLRAIELARKKVPKLRLVAFGAEPVNESLPLPADTIFHYLPSQTLIPRLYASCDVWLCGSYSEGFHLPPLEAMACRCPVVSTRVGGPIDIIECGRNGYLTPIGDAEMLADRLVNILQLDEEAWKTMSDAALATATRYTWNDATDLLEAAFRDLTRLAVFSSA